MPITYYPTFKNSSGNVGIGNINPGYRLDIKTATANGSTAFVIRNSNDTNNLAFYDNGTASSSSDFRAPIFYDTNNTAFYIDAAGTSVLSALTIGGNTALTTVSTLTAGNLSGTIPSGVLGNSTYFIGTTSIALNRGSASQTLTGVSIDGNAATATNVAWSGITSKPTTLSGFGITDALPLSGGTMTGYIIGAVSGLWNTYNQGSFTAYGNATNPALIAFHRPGYFATNFGLDTDGVIKIGGWSNGGPWPVLHSNNYSAYSTFTGAGTFVGSVAITTDASSGDSSLILHRYGGVNKVFSGYSAGQALYGGEAGIPTRIQAGGQYALTALANGNIGIGTTSPGYKLDVNGTARFGGIIYNEAVKIDDFNYFNLQPYIESETLSSILSVAGTAPTFATLTNTTAPFSKVALVSAYGEATMSEFIPVQAGETIYGEIWAYRATGATGTAGVLYCGVQRYDKDKKMIDSNAGLNTSPSGYFIASNQTIPSNSTWTKYSGTLVLPTSHTPYNTSDGGPVRYIRPYIIYNYTGGTIPTYFGGWKIRKTELTRDSGIVTINGNLSTTRIGNINVGSGTYLNTITPVGDTNINLSSPSGAFYFDTFPRMPGFYDSNDTNYYVDPASNSRLLNLGLGNVTPDLRLSVSGDAQLSGILYLGGTAGSYGSWGSRTYTTSGVLYNNSSSVEFNNYGYGSTWTFTLGGGNATSSGSFRAPIFYDSDNTAYYVDAASTSVFNAFTGSHSSGSVNVTSVNGAYIGVNNTTNTNGYGISLYNGAVAGEPTYGLMFQGTATFGTYGSVSGDWATYFTMNNDNTRGWIFRKGGTANVASISGGGVLTVAGDVRAPIFYDSNNTAYYTDPASTSNLLGLTVTNTITGSITGNAGTATSLANFTNQSGTRFSTDFNSIVTTGFFNGEATPANAPSGFTYAQLISAKGIDTGLQIAGGYTNDNLWFRGWGPSLTFTAWRSVVHSGNIASQTVATAGSCTGSSASCTGNAATTTLATKATRANGNFYIDDNFGNTVVGNYNAARLQGVFAMGDSYKLAADGTAVGTLYGLAWSHPNFGGVAANLASHGLLILENGVFKGAWGGGSLRTPGDVRGTLFYDWDNTGYYCDPASTSNLNTITAAGNVTAAQYYTANWFRSTTSGNGLYNEATGQHFYSDSVNYWNVASSASAQGIRLRTGGYGGTVRGYFYATDSNDVGLLNQDGNWRLRVVGGDYSLADGSSMRAQIFYDSNNTAYYLDPANTGTSLLVAGNVGIGTTSPTQILDVRGNIKLGGDNSGNYVYYVTDIERTIIRTTRSDVTQQGLFRSDGWGNFTADKSIGIGYSLGSGFDSNNIGNGNLYVAGKVGIGTTSPSYKIQVAGDAYITDTLKNGQVETRSFKASFPNVTANRAIDIRFPNTNLNGLIEIEVTSGYNYQNSVGVVKKIFSVGTNPNNGIWNTTVARVVEAHGAAVDNWTIGDFAWDATNSKYIIPIYHIVSSANQLIITIRYFSESALDYPNLPNTTVSAVYAATIPAAYQTRHYVYYNDNVGIGTTSPSQKLHVVGIGYSDTDFRAPIFYDSNDTTYYIDPANGGFNLRGGASNRVTFNSGDSGIIITNAEGISSNVRLGCAWGRPGIYNGSSITVGAETQIDFVISNVLRAYVDSSSNLFGVSSVRAPIFYDSNDTTYYTDPNGTSVLNRLKIDGGNYAFDYFQSLSDFVSGTLVTTDIPASAASGLSFVMNVIGKSYNTTTSPFDFNVQGYLYNSTIINYSGMSLDSTGLSTIKVFENGGFLCFWWARVSYWNAFEVSVRSYDAAKTNYNRVTNITDVVEPTGTKKVTVTLHRFMRADVSATNSVDLRAPIFYDSDNTAYYTDPASTSNLLGLTVVNTITGSITGNAGGSSASCTGNSATATTSTNVLSPDGDRNPSTKLPTTNARNVRFDFSGAGAVGGAGNYAGVMTYAPWDGTSASTGDSSYQLAFLNETGVNASGVPGLSLRNGINSTWNSWYRIITSGNIASQTVATAGSCTGNAATVTNGVYTGTNNTYTNGNFFQSNLGTTSGSLSSPPLQVYATGTNAAFMSFHRSGSFAVNFGLDSDNVLRIGGWSASANRLQLDMSGNLTIAAGIYATGFYDTNNTALYCDPTGTSLFTGLTVTNTITGSITGNAGGSSTSCSGNAASASYANEIIITNLGTATVSINNGRTAVYRNENGLGSNLAYSPVLHVAAGDTMWQVQGTYGSSGNGTFYFRQGYQGVFGNWLTMLSSANYNSYSPTLTGTGASGTWSINVTGNAGGSSASCTGNAASATTAAACSGNTAGTASSISGFNNPTTAATGNTIVYRSGGGDITGAYILGSYFNASAGNSENPTIGQIWTQNTTDNYLRKSTPAYFRSQVTDGSYPSLTGANASGTWSINVTGNAGGSSASCTGNAASATTAAACSGNTAGTASNITAYTINQSVGTANNPKFLNVFGERVALNSASPQTINTLYNVTELTLVSSIATLTFSNIQAAGIVHMWTLVTVGNATAYTITWPAAVKWPGGTAPTVTTTNTKRDIYQFVTYDGGTSIYAIIVGQNL